MRHSARKGTGMISDYMDYGAYGFTAPEETVMQPTYDVWGTVVAANDNTGKGSVRVKVKTMRDRRDTFDNVPVLTGYGGDEYGAFFLPEEGDIVRLTFLGGDFRHPVVTGCRFPESSRLVGDSSGEGNLHKLLKVKNGSSIAFSGEKGKEKIEISGPQKMKWELDEDREQIVFGDNDEKNRMVLDKKNGEAQVIARESIRLSCGKSSLELKKDGTVTLKCSRMAVEAQDVLIKGKTRIELDGQQLTLSGNTGIAVKAQGQVKIESKGQLKLSGTMIQLN